MSINHFSSSEFPATLWWSHHQQQQQQQYISLMEEDPNYPSFNLNKAFLSSTFPNNSSSSSSSSSSPCWPTQYTCNYHQATSWLNPYTHLPQNQSPPPNFDLNNQKDDAEEDPSPNPTKEPLFEKPLTPSDVGKLNRLVIPKQHAEKYFPLAGESVDKGLLLSFEDEMGKCWRFRYSYWNSSQSYVLTKGWSRYVKEKQLDAGDVVLFERHRTVGDRFFIGWRRKGDGGGLQGGGCGMWSSRGSYNSSSSSNNNNNNGNINNITTSATNVFQHGVGGNVTGGVQFQTHCAHAGAMAQDQPMPIGNSKRLRLFGVNLECQPDDQWSEPSTPDGSSMSSQGPSSHQQFSSQPAYNSYSSSSPSHMDGVSFSPDVNQMRNRRG